MLPLLNLPLMIYAKNIVSSAEIILNHYSYYYSKMSLYLQVLFFRGLLFNPLMIFCLVTLLPRFSPFSIYLIVLSETPESRESSLVVSPSFSLISRNLLSKTATIIYGKFRPFIIFSIYYSIFCIMSRTYRVIFTPLIIIYMISLIYRHRYHCLQILDYSP